MKKNMGTVDRVVRILAAVVVVALYLTGQISGTAAVVLGFFALVFVATSVVGTCPLYLPLKIDTRGKKD
jgi:Na+(H+)/acetate symporter ActP